MEVCHAISGTLDDRRADHGHRVTQRFSSHLNDSGQTLGIKNDGLNHSADHPRSHVGRGRSDLAA